MSPTPDVLLPPRELLWIHSHSPNLLEHLEGGVTGLAQQENQELSRSDANPSATIQI